MHMVFRGVQEERPEPRGAHNSKFEVGGKVGGGRCVGGKQETEMHLCFRKRGGKEVLLNTLQKR